MVVRLTGKLGASAGVAASVQALVAGVCGGWWPEAIIDTGSHLRLVGRSIQQTAEIWLADPFHGAFLG